MAAKNHTSWLITGGTGFIGQALVGVLLERGCHVTVLSRKPAKAAKTLGGKPTIVASLNDIAPDTKLDAVVNLAGEPLFGGLWTQGRKRAFFASRLGTTAALISLIERLESKPAVMVSGSAIGFYGTDEEAELTEDAPSGDDELAGPCRDWEQAALRVQGYGVRLICLRIGVTLDRSGGMLAPLAQATKLCLGARLGSGRQWLSWISRTDLVRLILFAADNEKLEGPLNGTAPAPVRQAEFADALAAALHRPRLFWIPGLLLKLLLGDMSVLLLEGQKVVPKKALDAGFSFDAPTIEDALR